MLLSPQVQVKLRKFAELAKKTRASILSENERPSPSPAPKFSPVATTEAWETDIKGLDPSLFGECGLQWCMEKHAGCW